jgi:gamma-glutamylaminecyclotransferase
MKLFVYGTLKRGFSNSWLLDDAKFLGEYTTRYRYPMFKLEESFPYLQNTTVGIGKIVKGELYEIDDFTDLDKFEDVPDLYHKNMIWIRNGDEFIFVYVYFKTDELTLKELGNIKLLEEWT